ncbi:rubrerythrin family protein [Methanofollis tationis]|uniref:Rubrerythrin family protein n=1 Tax=Methanofollis tationis TaxID=81417 RepID=A0A7K4HPX1_9EURY|nr:rubrerythrin family protein [Methanofollis tationis]NVO67212.1 rubrerythrin family protein [Methanofollis tationis]
MATLENLKAAFAGESQANRKYLSFSQKADEEGFKNVARIYRAASRAEEIHARRELSVMGGVRSTAENLKESIEGETDEFTEMYPRFVEEAKKEGNSEAAITFTHAMKAEEVHAGLYKRALEAVSAGKDFDSAEVFLCPVCGNVEIGAAPERCPICGVPGTKFLRVE